MPVNRRKGFGTCPSCRINVSKTHVQNKIKKYIKKYKQYDHDRMATSTPNIITLKLVHKPNIISSTYVSVVRLLQNGPITLISEPTSHLLERMKNSIFYNIGTTAKTKLFNKVSYKLQTHMPPSIVVSLIQVMIFALL